MKTNSKSTALSLSSDFTIDKIPSMLELITKEIKKLKGVDTEENPIKDPLGPFGSIPTLNNIDTLREAYTYVTNQVDKVSEHDGVFEKIINKKMKPIKIQGYSKESWQNLIIKQVNSITYKDKLEKLESIKKELEANLSAEMKLKASLSNIQDILSQ